MFSRHVTRMLAIAATIACTTTVVSAEGCGETPITPNITLSSFLFNQFIIGGSDAVPYSWPWQASICGKTFFGQCVTNCAATVIDSKWLVTLASCFAGNENPSVFHVRVGNYYEDTDEPGEQLLALKNIIVHPQYEDGHWSNDIALIELLVPMTYNDRVQPVCLSSVEINSPTAVATGYGFKGISDDGTPIFSNILRQVVLPIVDPSQCSSAYPEFDPTKMYCAGTPETSTAGGDDGGPLVEKATNGRWYQHGITAEYSFYDDQPGTFMKINAFCDDFITPRTGVRCTDPYTA